MDQVVKKRPPFWKRKYIVSKKFQLKYVGVILVSFILVLVLFKWYIHKVMNTLLTFVPNMVVDEMKPLLASSERDLMVTIFIMMVVLCCVMVYLTFKIAGPLFRIEKDLRNMIEKGVCDKKLSIRKGDETESLLITLNDFICKITERK
jgi:signal transduction histidine kinase